MFAAIASWRHRLGFLALFMLVACGDSAGCAGCAVQPIPGGFPTGDRVPNSVQMRLTESGLRFMESNGGALVSSFLPDGLAFDVPEMSGSGAGVDYKLCPTGTGTCKLRGEIERLTLTPVDGTQRLKGTARVVLDSRNGSLDRAPIPVQLDGWVVFGSETVCELDVDTTGGSGSRRYVEVEIDVDLTAESRAARAGYTRVRISRFAISETAPIEAADLRIVCPGLAGLLLGSAADAVKGLIIGPLQGAIEGPVTDAINEQICTKRGEYGCPTGTFAVPSSAGADAICRYSNSESADCVPILLGTDGQGDLGAAFLGGISPGTHGNGQFLLAAGGNSEMVNNGVSLAFYGGYRSTDASFATSPGHNSCVPVTSPPAIPTIPRVGGFRVNMPPGATSPVHASIGVSEDFLNHAAWGMFDSGLFCIDAGTRLSQMISTSLFSLLIGSLKDLSFPIDNAPIMISLRPQAAPVFDIRETDPLLNVTFPSLELDFYVWSSERYIRFMTYRADLSVSAGLAVVDGKLVPAISNVAAANPVVTNSELLSTPPAMLASVVQSVLGTVSGMLMSAVPPIALPELAGFRLEVPANGVRGYSEAGEDFLAVFANLAPATSTGGSIVDRPRALIRTSDLRLDIASMQPETYGTGAKNTVRLDFDTEVPSSNVEFSYRLDGKPWSAWSTLRSIVVEDETLWLQGRHVVEARARFVNVPESLDPTPARAEVLVDTIAPDAEIALSNDGFTVEAADIISPRDALRYRAFFGGAWTDWQADPHFVANTATEVRIEARDEAGNIAGRTAELRGLPNAAAAASGCACSVDGGDDASNMAWSALLLAAFGVVLGSRRRRALRSNDWLRAAIFVIAAPFVFSTTGCDCDDGSPMNGDGGTNPTSCNPACEEAVGSSSGSRCCEETNMCVAYDLNELCPGPELCASVNDVTFDGCTPGCSNCVLPPPLSPGLLATHLDMVAKADGTVLFAGYSAGALPGRKYGDLVFGEWNSATSSVDWQILDGLPTGGAIVGDPNGWRGGVAAGGPDVGKYTSMAMNGDDVYIAYYDATAGALKLAIRASGVWSTQVVDDDGDCGAHASITLSADGAPVIAYQCINPPAAVPGRPTSQALVAMAASASPSTGDDWDIRILQTKDTPCRASSCATGNVCLASGECAASAGGAATVTASFVEDLPVATGLFNSIASGPGGTYGVVFYDRITGDLRGARYDGSTWQSSFVIDGYSRAAAGVGDSGISASLFIDTDGKWYVSYVDGTEELLRLAVVDGTSVIERSVIDDGTTDGSARYADGQHIVGDDSSIVVTSAGEVRVVYQDATSQELRIATRPSTTAESAWTREALDTEDSTGYFAEQVLVGSRSYVGTWYRRGGTGSPNGVRVFMVD